MGYNVAERGKGTLTWVWLFGLIMELFTWWKAKDWEYMGVSVGRSSCRIFGLSVGRVWEMRYESDLTMLGHGRLRRCFLSILFHFLSIHCRFHVTICGFTYVCSNTLSRFHQPALSAMDTSW
jgi:hypothetical protein